MYVVLTSQQWLCPTSLSVRLSIFLLVVSEKTRSHACVPRGRNVVVPPDKRRPRGLCRGRCFKQVLWGLLQTSLFLVVSPLKCGSSRQTGRYAFFNENDKPSGDRPMDAVGLVLLLLLLSGYRRYSLSGCFNLQSAGLTLLHP